MTAYCYCASWWHRWSLARRRVRGMRRRMDGCSEASMPSDRARVQTLAPANSAIDRRQIRQTKRAMQSLPLLLHLRCDRGSAHLMCRCRRYSSALYCTPLAVRWTAGPVCARSAGVLLSPGAADAADADASTLHAASSAAVDSTAACALESSAPLLPF